MHRGVSDICVDDDFIPGDSKVFSLSDGIVSSNDLENDAFNFSASPIFIRDMLQGLDEMRANHFLTDITLVAENVAFDVHKMVLAIHSDYFKAMFTSGMSEVLTSRVELADITAEGLTQLLDYMYKGSFKVNHNNIVDVLGAAVFFQATGAMRICCKCLISELKQQKGQRLVNAAHLAEVYSFEPLFKQALKAILFVFDDIVAKGTYLDMTPKMMHYVFSSNSSKVPSEEKLLEIACLWVNDNIPEREIHLDSLLELIRFSQISSWKFHELTQKFTFLGESSMFKEQKMKSQVYSKLNLLERVFVQEEQAQLRGEPTVVAFGGKNRNAFYRSEHFFALHQKVGRPSQWIRASSTPKWFYQPGLAVLNNFLFVCGGKNSKDIVASSSYIFDPRCVKWMSISPMKVARANFPLVACGEYIYALGGEGSKQCLQHMEKFSVRHNKWMEVGEMPFGLRRHTACCIDDTIFVCGGEFTKDPIEYNPMEDPPDNVSNALMAYNTRLGSWTELQPMLRPMAGHSMSVTETNQIYILGGHSSVIHKYDPAADQWSSLDLAYYADNLRPEMTTHISVHNVIIGKSVFFINCQQHRCSVFSMADRQYKELDRYEDDVSEALNVCVLTMPVQWLASAADSLPDD